MKRTPLHLILLLVAVLGIATSCEDPIPDDAYVEELVVEGFAIAGRPLTDIRIFRTLSITDTFSLERAMIRDADVIITENGTQVPVRYVSDTLGGHYEAVDTSYRVKHNSTYQITVNAIGKTATATATTLAPFDWIAAPKDTMQYPGEARETERFDSLKVSWGGQSGVFIYVIGVECQDTLGYGQYLVPPTQESNRRIRDEEPDDDLLIRNERTRYGLALVANSDIVWRVFKWFGPHRLHIYAGDRAFQEWFQQVGFGGRSTYDYRLGNVEGALGVWAGASELTGEFFLKKDQP